MAAPPKGCSGAREWLLRVGGGHEDNSEVGGGGKVAMLGAFEFRKTKTREDINDLRCTELCMVWLK